MDPAQPMIRKKPRLKTCSFHSALIDQFPHSTHLPASITLTCLNLGPFSPSEIEEMLLTLQRPWDLMVFISVNVEKHCHFDSMHYLHVNCSTCRFQVESFPKKAKCLMSNVITIHKSGGKLKQTTIILFPCSASSRKCWRTTSILRC